MMGKFAYLSNMQTNKDTVFHPSFHCIHFHLRQVLNPKSAVSFILQWVTDRPLPIASMSKWSHFKLWPVDMT